MKLISLKIKIGELFRILDMDNELYEKSQIPKFKIFIPTPSNDLALINFLVKKKDNKVIKVVLEDGTSFKCSENHLVQDENGITNKVKNCNFLQTIYGLKRIVSKEFQYIKDVYDLSIDNPHLYITPNGVIHHNTFLALETAKNAQELGYFVVLYDSEMANNEREALKLRGIDTEQLLYIPIDTVENLKTSLLNILDECSSEDKLFIVIDSIGNLSTNKELEDSTEGSTTKDMTRPAQLKALFRTVTLKAGVKNVPIIAINHTYATIGSFVGGQTIAGGSGPMYNASIISEFTKAQEKGADGKMSGALVSSTVTKCRTAKERTKIKFTIDFEEGLTKYSGLQLFCEDEKLFIKDGRSYKLNPLTCPGVSLSIGETFTTAKMNGIFWEECIEKFLGDYLKHKFKYQSISEELIDDEYDEIES